MAILQFLVDVGAPMQPLPQLQPQPALSFGFSSKQPTFTPLHHLIFNDHSLPNANANLPAIRNRKCVIKFLIDNDVDLFESDMSRGFQRILETARAYDEKGHHTHASELILSRSPVPLPLSASAPAVSAVDEKSFATADTEMTSVREEKATAATTTSTAQAVSVSVAPSLSPSVSLDTATFLRVRN